jgi:PIN domain nuclease of toxin-antitoxin system
MLVAQARLEELTIVTRDPRFARYGVATLPA